MSALQDQIRDYLAFLGKQAATEFEVSPQKIGTWKRKPESAPFEVIEASTIWASQYPPRISTQAEARRPDKNVQPNISDDRTGGITEGPIAPPRRFDGPLGTALHAGEPQRYNWGEEGPSKVGYDGWGEEAIHAAPEDKSLVDPAPDDKTESETMWDRINEQDTRQFQTDNKIDQILSLLQGGGGQPARMPTATTQRLEPAVGPAGELPPLVSAGPVQAATDNLTRPSRRSGQAYSEADLDRLDPTRHKPAVDPSDLGPKHWMRPKEYKNRGR